MSGQLIVVGASARAAAFSASRAGFRPYAVDQFADGDLAVICPAVRVVRYPHDFLAALQNAPQAPWIYTGGLENHPRLVERLAEIRPLWGNGGAVLRQVRNPDALAATVREVGMEMPAMRRQLTAEEFSRTDEMWLRKPFRSSGGNLVRIASPGLPLLSKKHYYQRYVAGPTGGAVFCAVSGNCQLLGVSQQLRAPRGDFRYLGSIVEPKWWLEVAEPLQRLGQALVDRFQLQGLFNLDFIQNAAGIWPLEVNPRYSASVELLERATGEHFLALHAAAFDPQDQPRSARVTVRPPTDVFGKAVVYADRSAPVPPEFDRLVEMWNERSRWPTIADLPRVGEQISRGQPLCTVFADGANQDEVERALSDQVRRVQERFFSKIH